MKNIIFTGGGSGGHVLPALSLIDELRRTETFAITYLGSFTGIERGLVTAREIPYHAVSTGKLRRYWSWRNFTDVGRVIRGFLQAFRFLWSFSRRDTLLFSTGGFVVVPVVLAAWLQRKKIFIHEQTSRVGLANSISARFASNVFVTFSDSLQFFPPDRTIHSGYPLRRACFSPEFAPIEIAGRDLSSAAPLMFVTGGGNGSALLNGLIRRNLSWLVERVSIVHQVGKSFLEEYAPLAQDRYIVVDFVGDNFLDLLKAATVVVSRAGAGTVCELLAVGRRSILVPLKIAQKNEQLHNAKEAEKLLASIILEEDALTDESFKNAVTNLLDAPERRSTGFPNGLDVILTAIHAYFADSSVAK